MACVGVRSGWKCSHVFFVIVRDTKKNMKPIYLLFVRKSVTVW